MTFRRIPGQRGLTPEELKALEAAQQREAGEVAGAVGGAISGAAKGIGRFFSGELTGPGGTDVKRAQLEMSQRRRAEAEGVGPLAEMAASADPEEVRNLLVNPGREEAQALRQQADEMEQGADAVEQELEGQKILKGLQKIQQDRVLQQSIKTSFTQQLGASEEQLEEATVPMNQAIQDLNEMIAGNKDALERIRNKQSLLTKDVGTMTEQEKLGLGLVALLPMVMAAVAGGEEGIQAAVVAMLGGTGAFLTDRQERLARESEQFGELEGLAQQVQQNQLQLLGAREELSAPKEDLQNELKRAQLEEKRLDIKAKMIDIAAQEAAAESGQDPRLADVKELQWKSAGFANRMVDAEAAMTEALKDFDPASGFKTPEVLTPEGFKSEPRKVFEQAITDFITANLRLESGAAIPPEEVENEKVKYAPARGDGPKALARKAEARRNALAAMQAAAGDLALSEVRRRKQELLKKEAGLTEADIDNMSEEDLLKFLGE